MTPIEGIQLVGGWPRDRTVPSKLAAGIKEASSEEQEQLKNQLSSDDLFTLPQALEKDIEKLKRQSDSQNKIQQRLTAEMEQIEKKLKGLV